MARTKLESPRTVRLDIADQYGNLAAYTKAAAHELRRLGRVRRIESHERLEA